ncbi:uncharacterized protein THITE_153904 [Thermothielavioides terrestris NRRL 8126]|uniref:Uncharacterized protein n=1 Tax=Thermothielavioides terrestris (strain ATCC 38088 / NRRL 8126) TaxID=578455 RepID=G2QQJ3_THETT|nr:uncharacterized protein THITE_153904 [Thermothielavioides terrestris NRRL 8126]AEO62403.1 hypothetical protein THITE_153904 [Thermothielavioides terrestris NRRL 8126]
MSHSPNQQVNGGEAFAPMADPANTSATSNPSGTRRGSHSTQYSSTTGVLSSLPHRPSFTPLHPSPLPPSLLLPSPPLPSPHPSLRQSHQPFPQPPSSLLPPPLPLAYISLSASGPTVFDWLQVLSGLAAPPAAADPAVELEDPEPVAVPECDTSSCKKRWEIIEVSKHTHLLAFAATAGSYGSAPPPEAFSAQRQISSWKCWLFSCRFQSFLLPNVLSKDPVAVAAVVAVVAVVVVDRFGEGVAANGDSDDDSDDASRRDVRHAVRAAHQRTRRHARHCTTIFLV